MEPENKQPQNLPELPPVEPEMQTPQHPAQGQPVEAAGAQGATSVNGQPAGTDQVAAGAPGEPAQTTKNGSRWNSIKGFLSVIELVGGALLLALAINGFVFQSYQVFGQSMVPTLDQGNRLIVSKMSKSWSSLFGNQYVPARGEIIVFENPINRDVQLVKRVIGLPGDRVTVNNSEIRVYNEEFPYGFDPDADYKDMLDPVTSPLNVDIVVPEDHIFVSGDNRSPGGSLDSRNDLGTIPLDNVVGSLFVRIFPLSDAQFF